MKIENSAYILHKSVMSVCLKSLHFDIFQSQIKKKIKKLKNLVPL